MKKLLLVLILSPLMSMLCYCQVSYPRKIVFENDTCVIISIDQTKALNFKLQRKKFLESQYMVMNEQSREYLRMIHSLSKQVVERDQLIHQYEEQANKVNEVILFEQKKNKMLEKKLRAKNRREAIMLGAIGALTGLLILSQ